MASINLDLPRINGPFEVGLSVGLDPSLLDGEKLPVVQSCTRETAAIKAAMWAYTKFAREGEEARKLYVSGAAAAIMAGFTANIGSDPDGDWIEFHQDPPGISSIVDPDIAKIQPWLAQECLRTALVIIMATKANFWQTNHHTGQSAGGEYLFNYIRKVAIAKLSPTAPQDRALSTCIHTIGHWCSTIKILTIAGIKGPRAVSDDPRPVLINVKLSDDASLRFLGLPAGTHKTAIAFEAPRRLDRQGIKKYCPRYSDMASIALFRQPILLNLPITMLGLVT